MKNLSYITVFFAIWVLLFSPALAEEEKREIVIGATVGDFSDIVTEGLRPQLEQQGYTVRLVQFTDYVQPNIALAEGRLDVNIFQHLPYLEQFTAQKGGAFAPLAEVPTAPLGLYAGKKKQLTEVADGVQVAVPNDPTNLARALFILRDVGWVTLKDGVDEFHASPKDIVGNPYRIRIVQLEAAQLPRVAQDVDYAIINGNYVVSSGLKLTDALAHEQGNSYVNWAVVRQGEESRPFAKAIVTALASESFKAWAHERFAGYKYPQGW